MEEETKNEESTAQEEKPTSEKTEQPEEKKEVKPKKAQGKWFRKIPKEILFSPGGAILIFLAVIIEVSDFLITDFLLPGASLTIEVIPDMFFGLCLMIIAHIPFQSLIIPFLLERIPIISDIIPTWLIRLLM